MFIKHPAAWVTGSIGSMRDSKATWRSCSFRLMRLIAFSLSVVCTFASSTDIFLWSPCSHGHCCIHAVYPSRYRLEAHCHYNNVTSYIVFFDILQLQCLQRVLGADVFQPGECHWLKISHQCVKTGFSFTSTTLNILEEALVLSI